MLSSSPSASPLSTSLSESAVSAQNQTPGSVTLPAKLTERALAGAWSLDLSFVHNRLSSKLGWSEERCETAVNEYRRFLHLIVTYGSGKGLVPSKDVDEAWHAHILFTRQYARDCHAIHGRFIHHNPIVTRKETESDAHGGREGIARTLKLYAETFGEAPGAGWPTLADLKLRKQDECDECSAISCRSQCPSCNAACDDD
jgi:hypothetical protein